MKVINIYDWDDLQLLDKYIRLNENEISDFFFKLKHVEKLKAEHIRYEHHWSEKKCYKCPSGYDRYTDTDKFTDWINIGEYVYRLGDFEWNGMVTHYLAKHQFPIFEKDFYDFINTTYNELNLINIHQNNIPKLKLTNKTEIKKFLEKLGNIERTKISNYIDMELCSSIEETEKLQCNFHYKCWKNYSWSDKQLRIWSEKNNIYVPEVFYKDVMETDIPPPISHWERVEQIETLYGIKLPTPNFLRYTYLPTGRKFS